MDRSARGARQPVAATEVAAAAEAPLSRRRRPRRPERSRLVDRLLTAVYVLVPILLLAGLGATLGYVRLLHGPVSLKFLVAPIERGWLDNSAMREALTSIHRAGADVVITYWAREFARGL